MENKLQEFLLKESYKKIKLKLTKTMFDLIKRSCDKEEFLNPHFLAKHIKNLPLRVIDLEENGNLIIEGKRTTKVNGETQYVTIKGVVRPVDVRPDNSVYSYSILDLTLLIDGDGSVSEYQEPGLITKFLRMLF